MEPETSRSGAADLWRQRRQVTSGSAGHYWMASAASPSGVRAAPPPRRVKLASKLLVLRVDHLNALLTFQALLRRCLFRKQ